MDLVVNGEKNEIPIASKPLCSLGDYYQNTLLCLGYKPQYLPLAQLLKLYHQLTGRWLIASPVHWQATHNDAMLVAAGQALELAENESALLFAEVAEFLKTDGFSPVYHDAQIWLFNIDDKPEICSQSVQTLLHQSLMPILKSLDKSSYWQRLITELQMYLSAHPLNAKRQGPAINGLWFWGEDEFKLEGSRAISSDDEVLLSYAAATGATISPLTPATRLAKDHLILIKDPKQIDFCGLEEKIKKNTVNWYWNNCSYSTKASHWWSRLWR